MVEQNTGVQSGRQWLQVVRLEKWAQIVKGLEYQNEKLGPYFVDGDEEEPL